MIDPANNDYIIAVECISSTGKTIPPMLPVFGVNILHTMSHNNDLNIEILISKTESDSANNYIALELL